MKINKKIIATLILFTISLIFLIAMNFLGAISRTGYLTSINFLEKIDNEFVYTINVGTEGKIFKYSDLYYLFINEKRLPEYITKIDPNKIGHPKNIKIFSLKELDSSVKYEIEYVLKLKEEVYIISLMFCFLMLLVTIHLLIINKKKRIILMYFSYLVLIILNELIMKLYLNYIGIFLAISLYTIIILDNIKFNFENSKYEKTILFLSALFVGFSNVFIINIQYPLVGEDISMILPRAYSLLVYAKNNGIFNIEFASPLFGAGLISYPNPQYDQFSIFYFLRYIMPFWKAYSLCFFIFSIIGFFAYYFFTKEVLKLSFKISLMSSLLFSFTGYYIHHVMIGHWAFLYHPLTALIVYFSFSEKFNYCIRILINALIFSIMIFGGSMQTIFFNTCFTLLGIAAILFKPNKKFIFQCLSIILSCALGIILSLSKFIQSVYFGSLIDRGGYGLYANDPLSVLRDNFANFSYPFHILISLSNDYRGLIWERDIGLSVFMILLLFYILFYYLKSTYKEKKEFIVKYKLNIILILIFTYLYFDIFFSDGLIRSLIPKLRSVNLHLRLFSTLIIPIIMIFSIVFYKTNIWDNNKKNIIITFTILSTIIIYYHRFINIKNINVNYIEYNIKYDNEVFHSIISNHNKYKVSYINNKLEIDNMTDFLKNSFELNTSRLPYESIYGYDLRTFIPKEEGSPFKINDNKYNFTDPRSLIFFNDDFPQFSGFSTNDLDKLNNFLSFKEVKWEVPKDFIQANYISIISHVIVLFILLIYFTYYLLKNTYKKISVINRLF